MALRLSAADWRQAYVYVCAVMGAAAFLLIWLIAGLEWGIAGVMLGWLPALVAGCAVFVTWPLLLMALATSVFG